MTTTTKETTSVLARNLVATLADVRSRMIIDCGVKTADADAIVATAKLAITYAKGNAEVQAKLRSQQVLEQRWYHSLAKKEPDLGVYADPLYVAEVLACWWVYSRGYVRSIATAKLADGRSLLDDFGDVKTIVDLGCGIGVSTSALKQTFPRATVVGTNVDGALQTRIAATFARDHGWTLVTGDGAGVPPTDLVLASEYFEHFEDPIEELVRVLQLCQPRRLLVANGFGTRAIGHFDTYRLGDGSRERASKLSALFRESMHAHGYREERTKLWNQRPTYWVKRGAMTEKTKTTKTKATTGTHYIHEDLRPLAVPIESLTLDPNNVRTHDSRNLEAIRSSLEQFGFRSVVVVRGSDRVVLAGNARVVVAQSLGWTHVPAMFVSDHDADAMMFAIADNRTAELAGWDEKALASILATVAEEHREALGFNESEVARLMTTLVEAVEAEQEAQNEWRSMPEFRQEDKTAFRTIPVHFHDQAAVDKFAELTGQKITENTRYLWFPEMVIERLVDKEFTSEEPA